MRRRCSGALRVWRLEADGCHCTCEQPGWRKKIFSHPLPGMGSSVKCFPFLLSYSVKCFFFCLLRPWLSKERGQSFTPRYIYPCLCNLCFLLFQKSGGALPPQHQGTRVTSPTVAVPEATWFPDVVFAKTMFCFVLIQISRLNFVLEMLLLLWRHHCSISSVPKSLRRSLVYLLLHYYKDASKEYN